MTTLIDSETQHSIKTKVDIHEFTFYSLSWLRANTQHQEMAAMLKVGPNLLAFSFGF